MFAKVYRTRRLSLNRATLLDDPASQPQKGNRLRLPTQPVIPLFFVLSDYAAMNSVVPPRFTSSRASSFLPCALLARIQRRCARVDDSLPESRHPCASRNQPSDSTDQRLLQPRFGGSRQSEFLRRIGIQILDAHAFQRLL